MFERQVIIAVKSRSTLHVDEVPGLEKSQVWPIIIAYAQGLVAKRALYFTAHSGMGKVDRGYAAVGSASPSSAGMGAQEQSQCKI